jgi:type II secretory ATPase GspE/PulE/Tfp pilus assembly ATPase PilB-like protein
VLATLHTNDAPSAIPRLIDIGVEHYLVTSSLLGVLAQRLLPRGGRCETCYGTGYSGRVAIYEIMRMSDELRRLVLTTADARALRNQAAKEGMRGMMEDGLDKVARGLTTEEELKRVLAEG